MAARHHHYTKAPNRFAALLRKRRKELNITTDEVAERLAKAGYEIKSPTVSSWETYGNLPPHDSISAFARALELPVAKVEHAFESSVVYERPPYRRNGQVSRGKQSRSDECYSAKDLKILYKAALKIRAGIAPRDFHSVLARSRAH